MATALTDDARLIGLATASATLPWLLLGPVGGAIVDRFDRRRLIVAAQLLNNVVGLALGSVLYATFVELPFLVDAATFAVAAALVIGIRRPLQPERIDLAADDGAPGGLMADIVTGGRFLLGHPFLRDLTLGVTLSNFAGNVVFGMLVVLVVDELGAPEAAFGTILALGAVGGVVGSLVAGWLAARFGRNRVLSAMPFLVAVSYLAFAVAPLGALLGGAITNANGVRSAMWTATALEVVAALVLLAVLQRSPARERQGVEKKGVE